MGFGTIKIFPGIGYNVFKGKMVATVGPIDIPLGPDKKKPEEKKEEATEERKPEVPAEPEQRLDPAPAPSSEVVTVALLLLVLVAGVALALWGGK